MPGWLVAYLLALAVAAALFRAATGPFRPPPFLRLLVIRVAVVLFLLSPLAILILWFASERAETVPAVLPAALAGSVVAAGWLVTFVLRQYEAMQERDQTSRDTLSALREEVFTVLETLEKTDWKTSSKSIQRLIMSPPSGEDAYYPFSSTESRPIIYETLASNLLLVDEVTARAIVRFYAEFNDLRALVEDTKREDFAALDAKRRAGFHVHLTTQRRNTVYFALRAIYRMNYTLGHSDPELIPRGNHSNADILLDKDGLV